MKKGAQDGKAKLQFPTGETAMKIEGLGEVTTFQIVNKKSDAIGNRIGGDLTPQNMKIGQEIHGGGHSWIIADVLGDGKFKAVQKRDYSRIEVRDGKVFGEVDTVARGKRVLEIPDHWKETFDISGKVDTSNPIYRFYESEIGTHLQKRYGAVRITDAHGVSWWQMEVTPEQAALPVQAVD